LSFRTSFGILLDERQANHLKGRKENCHMDTASGLVDGNRVPNPALRGADEIYEACFHHSAIAALQAFNTHFDSRSLTRSELRLFLASMASFNRHTIGGIAILAGRLSDEILPLLPKCGHEIGAYVLDAAVDEYGLRESVTHVELARNFAEHLGISAKDVEAKENACAAAMELGEALFSWYRQSPVGFSLGVHAASEVTSVQEFVPWHDTFLKFPEYRCSCATPEFEYMRAHAVHEPDHINGAKLCIRRYLDVFPDHGSLLQEGAQAYLLLYERMLRELDARIFGVAKQ
jgi:predicted hydrocarbon binding protein